MRISKFKTAIASVALASIVSALVACDQAQDSTPAAEVSPIGNSGPIAGAAPEETPTPASEGPEDAAGQATLSTPDDATRAPRRTSSPASREVPTPAAATPQAQPETQATPAADPHAGHDMQSMADHDMEGM